jgi:hypothetical protein|tara:strand:+ start:3693 stop:4112 length:420 start_codon:yes stop_codon:yes gene_type:complete
MRTQLLCTFAKKERLSSIIELIIKCHDVLFDKIYIFSNENDLSQLICTYNIPSNHDNFIEGMDTIALHRKKQSNTLYTINALNEVIRSKNNGVLDKKFPIEWSEFQNTLLLVNEGGLNQIPTKIYKVINTETWSNEQHQ